MDYRSITDTLARNCQNPREDGRSQHFYNQSIQNGILPVDSRRIDLEITT